MGALTCTIHTIGAVAAIGGFCGLEFFTLFWYRSKGNGTSGAVMSTREWWCRFILNILCALSIVAFQLGGALANSKDFGNRDVWVNVTRTNVNAAKARGKYWTAVSDERLMEDGFKGLYDTASGLDLAIKKLE